MADMPGLIEGASDGLGLGHRFLKHIERTALFLFVITQDLDPERTPIDDFNTLRAELARYDSQLAQRHFIVALSQCDRPDVLDQLDEVRAAIGPDVEVIPISSVTGMGLEDLHRSISNVLNDSGKWSSSL